MSYISQTGDGSLGLFQVPSPRDEFTDAEMFLDSLSWAETCLVEDFKSISGISITGAAGSYHIIPNNGVVMNVSGVLIEGENRTRMSPSSNEITVEATPDNTGGVALPVLTNSTYAGNFSETYLVEITVPGVYGTAKVTVTRNSDGTKLVDDETIMQFGNIPVENDVEFSWDDTGETFDYADSWTIAGSTGNIKYIIADIKPSNAALELEVSLNNGATWFELDHFVQKAEQDDWGPSYTGPQLKWKIKSTAGTTLTHLYIATGDDVLLNNWPNSTSS